MQEGQHLSPGCVMRIFNSQRTLVFSFTNSPLKVNNPLEGPLATLTSQCETSGGQVAQILFVLVVHRS